MEDVGTVAVHSVISTIADIGNDESKSQLVFILIVREPVQISFMSILAAGILKFGLK